MRIITAAIEAALGFFIKPNPPPRHELSWPSYSMILFRSDIYECSLERAVRIPEQLCSQLPKQPFAAIRLIELVRVQGRNWGPAGISFCDDSPPSPTFVPGQNHRRIMQNIERPSFCQPCQKPTQHQIRYRSDPDFIGRVLMCENCGQRKLEPLGPGTCCQDC